MPFRYLVDSLSLPESFVSWHLLVYLTWSKPTVNKVLIIIILIIILEHLREAASVAYHHKYISLFCAI